MATADSNLQIVLENAEPAADKGEGELGSLRAGGPQAAGSPFLEDAG